MNIYHTTLGIVVFLIICTILFTTSLPRRPPSQFSNHTLTLSTLSEIQINKFLANENILGLAIHRVNLNLNTTKMIYYVNNTNPPNEIPGGLMSPFAFSYDYPNNLKMINVINGDIKCEISNEVRICQMAIPTAINTSGDFIGFITIFIKMEMSMDEQIKIINETKHLADSIYQLSIINQRGNTNE